MEYSEDSDRKNLVARFCISQARNVRQKGNRRISLMSMRRLGEDLLRCEQRL